MKRSRSPTSTEKALEDDASANDNNTGGTNVELVKQELKPSDDTKPEIVGGISTSWSGDLPAETNLSLKELYHVATGTLSRTSNREGVPLPNQYPFSCPAATVQAALDNMQRKELKGSAQTEEEVARNGGIRRYPFQHGLHRARFQFESEEVKDAVASLVGEFMRRRFIQLYEERVGQQ